MRLAFLDTETTGLDPLTEQVWEIALIREDGSEYEWSIRPDWEVVAEMHPKALEVTRYHERTASPWHWDAIYGQASSVLDEIEYHLHGAHIIGACPDFDARHLTQLFNAHDRDAPSWHYHLIDVENLGYGWALGKGLLSEFTVPIKSDDLSLSCGVEPPTEAERHTALGDARWVKRWFDEVTA